MPWIRTILMVGLAVTPAAAGDWPQWLGPQRDGATSEVVAKWTEAPRVLWRHPVGEGHSSPVVANGKVYLHARVKDKSEERLAAFDAVTGKLLWEKTYPRGDFSNPFGNGPRATPAVHGGRVYSLGVTGILSCFQADTGDEAWRVNVLQKFNARNLFFGVSCSPLVEGGKVLVNVGGKGASVVAFSADKGEVVWQQGDDPASYSSPVAFGEGQDRRVVFLTQQGVAALDPASGAQQWKFPLVDKLNESSTTPIRVGDILLASSVTYGTVALQLPAGTRLWKRDDLTCYFGTPVAVGTEHVYLVTGAATLLNAQANLHCVEAKTGKELWSKPRVGKYHATLLRTGDNKLLMLEEAGNLVLLDPSPQEYKELCRAKVSGETWAHPALAHGRLYVRDARELICLQLGK